MKKLFIIGSFLVFCLTIVWLIVWWNSPRDQRAKLIVESRKAWATPIQFFGKVVDEHGNPVEGATVRFQVTDLSARGVSEYHTKSDMAGLFTLTNVTGKHLGVYISKDGYFTSKLDRTTFEYAAGGGQYGIFTPDSKNPIVFRLKKKKENVMLIEKELHFKLRLDGTPMGANLSMGKASPLDESEVIMVYFVSDLNAQRDYDWRLRISVPNGGLLPAVGEFLFEAPEVGYIPFDEIHMAAGENNWRSSAERSYFLKLKNGTYAVVNIYVETSGDRFVILEYYLNPTGARDLEHDPKKRGL